MSSTRNAAHSVLYLQRKPAEVTAILLTLAYSKRCHESAEFPKSRWQVPGDTKRKEHGDWREGILEGVTDGQENLKNPGVDGQHRTTETPSHQCSQWPSSVIELPESFIASLPCPVPSLPVLAQDGAAGAPRTWGVLVRPSLALREQSSC